MSFAFVPTDAVARVRARIDHPVIDADGHLLEFLPLVNDLVREVAGNDVADRYQRFMRRALAPDDAGFMPARVFWGLPEEHTLDRMTVTLPKLTYERADEMGLDFLLLYPSFGLTVLAVPGRRGAPGRRPRPEHVLRGGVRGLPRSPRTGRGHPHLLARGSGRRARPRGRDARAEGGGDERRGPPLDASRRHRRRVGRHARARQHPRLRPALGPVRGAGGGTRLPRRGVRLGQPGVADELRVQPPGQLRRRPGGCLPLPGDGRGDAPLPRSALRVPRGRDRLGRAALRRPARPLREAQYRRRGHVRPSALRRRPVRAAPRPVRHRSHRRRAATVTSATRRRPRRRLPPTSWGSTTSPSRW